MEKLLELLKDGHTRSVEILAIELNTSIEDIKRQLEYLEHMGILKRISFSTEGCSGNCKSCGGCSSEKNSGAMCKGCLPAEGFQNMGEKWYI